MALALMVRWPQQMSQLSDGPGDDPLQRGPHMGKARVSGFFPLFHVLLFPGSAAVQRRADNSAARVEAQCARRTSHRLRVRSGGIGRDPGGLDQGVGRGEPSCAAQREKASYGLSVATPGYQRRGAQLGDRMPVHRGQLRDRAIQGNARVVIWCDSPGPLSHCALRPDKTV